MMENELDRQIGVAESIPCALLQTVVAKVELSQKGKVFKLLLDGFPTHSYWHKLWEVNERMRLWIQMTKMIFLHWMAGFTL